MFEMDFWEVFRNVFYFVTGIPWNFAARPAQPKVAPYIASRRVATRAKACDLIPLSNWNGRKNKFTASTSQPKGNPYGMKLYEEINHFNHDSKQSTSQFDNRNFTKSLSSQSTKKCKPYHRLHNINQLKRMTIYTLIDWK